MPHVHEWQRCITKLKNEMPESDINAYILPLQPCLVSDRALILYAPNAYILDQIERQMLPRIKSIVTDLFNLDEVKVVLGGMETYGKGGAKTRLTPGGGRARQTASHPERPSMCLKEGWNFGNFVEGDSNRLACRAARDFLDSTHNLLIIHGSCGMGKTHLLHAIGIRSRELLKKKVLMIQALDFLQSFTSSFKRGGVAGNYPYRSLFGKAELLLVDDLQFVAGKVASESELFQILCDAMASEKKVVMTCNKAPGELPGLQEGFASRLRGGLVTRIDPPDFDTRLAIIRKKSELFGLSPMCEDVARYLAKHVGAADVRDIEGALKSLRMQITTRDIHVEDVRHHIRRQLRTAKEVTIEEILRIALDVFGVTRENVIGRSRIRRYVQCRQAVMWLAKEHTGMSYKDIGEQIGGRDYSTVMNACKRITEIREENHNLRRQIDETEKRLSQ